MKLRDVLIAAGVVTAVSLAVGKCYSGRADAWENRVTEVLAESKTLRARVVVLEDEAEDLRSQAADEAGEAAAREPVIRERIERLPPAVTPGEIERDEIIEEVVVNRDKYKLAYELSKMANNKLKLAVGVALARGDSLESVLEDRPGKKSWLIPELGVGPFVGICAGGNPCAGPIALTLTWKLSL